MLLLVKHLIHLSLNVIVALTLEQQLVSELSFYLYKFD